ncbi:acylaminoacyl peptidase [Legionella santicrucis]|uniref:Acylaminoacyl peptidase n=1 Tax=Legionella santicrucis TaxID=45074 RepID=A0A0W0Z3G1_9GAMM|nr:translocation protein TolB [Legionella santicrucis]KTD63673.1 acylaminoacyl peptidase [Legionella santicrucis]
MTSKNYFRINLISMRIPVFLFSLIYCVFVHAYPMIAFERSGFIWSANLDGSKARKITAGYVPEISPDGKYIAYNTADNQSSDRHLAIVELKTGKVTQLQNIPSQNNFNPVWSPDSKRLLFNTFIDNNWYLALINADSSGYRLLKDTQNKYTPAWAHDGKSFLNHDIDAIYWMDLEGMLLKKWPLDTLIPHGSMSSASRIQVSPDGKTLLMDVDMDEEVHEKTWEGPPPALWTLDLKSGKTIRITPKGMLAWSPFWINSHEFIFLKQGKSKQTLALYRGSLKNLEEAFLLNDVQTPSISR